MTPAEHRAEAERLLALASNVCEDNDLRPCLPSGQPVAARTDLQFSMTHVLARAHVHALLAQDFE